MLVALLAALVGVQVISLTAQRSADQSAASRVRLARDVEQIRYYDELMTMSARLAASSGDTSYVRRYQKAVPELDRVITDALSVAPDRAAQRAVHATDRANQELIALEQESFRRLYTGDRAGAYTVITSEKYAALKADYRQGMDVALERLQVAGDQQQDRAQHRGLPPPSCSRCCPQAPPEDCTAANAPGAGWRSSCVTRPTPTRSPGSRTDGSSANDSPMLLAPPGQASWLSCSRIWTSSRP
jgi:hypothetical protein